MGVCVWEGGAVGAGGGGVLTGRDRYRRSVMHARYVAAKMQKAE